MFSSSHEIWKFAYLADELGDWLPYAEDLVRLWATQSREEVLFKNTFDIILASLLLMDGLLPPPARQAFAKLTLDVISEAGEKKLAIDCLKIKPPRPGRKNQDRRTAGLILFAVKDLIKGGHSKTEAYDLVAKKYFKSPDTIRRAFERAIKRSGEARKHRGN